LTSFRRNFVLLEIVTLANSKKNRNIKTHPNDYPLPSFDSTNFCFFKTLMYVSMFLCFRFIVRCFQCFVFGLSPFGKVSHEPPLPLGNYCLWTPPPPRNFQWSSVGGGGGGWGGWYGYLLKPHVATLNVWLLLLLFVVLNMGHHLMENLVQ